MEMKKRGFCTMKDKLKVKLRQCKRKGTNGIDSKKGLKTLTKIAPHYHNSQSQTKFWYHDNSETNKGSWHKKMKNRFLLLILIQSLKYNI